MKCSEERGNRTRASDRRWQSQVAHSIAVACLLLTMVSQRAFAAAPEVLRVEYIAHAAFRLVASDGSALVIDPYADRVWISYEFPRELQAEAWLISHPHYDHDGGEYRGMEPPWAPGARVLRFPGEYEVGPFRVIGVPGRHAEPYGEEFGRFNTLWRIEVADLRLLHWGDNEPWQEPMERALGTVDILFVPVDGVEHLLSFEEVEEIVDRLEPRVVIPMHYRIPNLEPDPNRPEDLGPIDPWLRDRTRVVRNGSHVWEVSTASLPEGDPETRLLEHAPYVVPVE